MMIRIEINGPLASGKTHAFDAMMKGLEGVMRATPRVVLRDRLNQSIGNDHPTEIYEVEVR